jgi:hypothetical protein
VRQHIICILFKVCWLYFLFTCFFKCLIQAIGRETYQLLINVPITYYGLILSIMKGEIIFRLRGFNLSQQIRRYVLKKSNK